MSLGRMVAAEFRGGEEHEGSTARGGRGEERSGGVGGGGGKRREERRLVLTLLTSRSWSSFTSGHEHLSFLLVHPFRDHLFEFQPASVVQGRAGCDEGSAACQERPQNRHVSGRLFLLLMGRQQQRRLRRGGRERRRRSEGERESKSKSATRAGGRAEFEFQGQAIGSVRLPKEGAQQPFLPSFLPLLSCSLLLPVLDVHAHTISKSLIVLNHSTSRSSISKAHPGRPGRATMDPDPPATPPPPNRQLILG